MNKTQTATRTTSAVVNGRDLNIGDLVLHPRTGRVVELIEEMNMEGDERRRFLVQGVRGGYDALEIGETTAIELA